MPKVDPTTTSSWRFYEYCCADDSVLTDWCLRHNIAATRLGLPDHDMSCANNVEALGDELITRAKA
eukprot:8442191-Heterocapsa_arctica.AAC.1